MATMVELIHRFNTQIGFNLPLSHREMKTLVKPHQFRDLALQMLLSVTTELQAMLKELTFHQRTSLLLHLSFKASSNSTQTLTSFQLRLELPVPTLFP